MPKRLAWTEKYRAEILEYEEPALQPTQVRIKMTTASGKHGTTFAMFDGGVFNGQNFDADRRIFTPSEGESRGSSFPMKTGNIGLGTVVEAGSDASMWKPGDKVVGLLDIRETNVADESSLFAAGDVDPVQVLCIEPGYVAIHCVRESNVRFGETVAVFGLGAIGLMAVKMAALSGASRVYAVDPIALRRDWALSNGADKAFDPTGDGDVASLVHDLTGGKGVDVAIEVSGSYHALAAAIRSTRIEGTVCSAGFYQREAHDLWLGREWHHNRLSMIVPHGCGWGHYPRDYPRWDERRAYETQIELMQKGVLQVPGLIDPIGSLDDGPALIKKVVDTPDQVTKFGITFES